MPPTGTLRSPTGLRVMPHSPTDTPDIIAAHLERCAALRAEALATPISDTWDEMDQATYMRYLDETEANLKGRQ